MNSDFLKKLLIVNLPLRPSKGFLFDQLEKRLFDIRGEIGLDAASASFKNRRMFKTKYYYGLDVDRNALTKGILKQGDDKTFGVLADLARLDGLPGDSVDAVVSTNTLYCLKKEDRIAAIKHLCRLTAPEGYFFCEIPVNENYDYENVLAVLRNNFESIKIIYYRNFISRFYESIFESNGWLGDHPVAGLKGFRLFAWLIGRLEYITSALRSPKKHAFIICKNKKGSNQKKRFDLSGFPMPEKSIYNILDES
jgi:hypothetical protein